MEDFGILWLIFGFFVGLLVAWLILDPRCRKQLAEQEERLRAANAKTSRDLQKELDAHGETRRRLEEMEARDGKNTQHIAQLKSGLDSAAKELDAAKTESAGLQQELQDAKTALQEIDTLRDAGSEKDSKIADLNAELEAASKELEGAKADKVRLASELDSAEGGMDAVKARSEDATRRADEAAARVKTLEADLAAANEKADAAEAEAARLRDELSDARSAPSPAVPDLPVETTSDEAETKPAADEPEPEEKTEPANPEPASPHLTLVPSAGDAADDLTKIKGIGKVLNRKLNDLGVTTFAQIAAFTQEDIDRINEVLDFPGRIEREKWVDQAKDFAADSS